MQIRVIQSSRILPPEHLHKRAARHAQRNEDRLQVDGQHLATLG